jgi:membrane-associated phospholipid phosphatase
VKRVGEVNSAERPKDRTDVARFYAVTDVLPLYNTAARQVSEAQGKTISENARIFALLNMAIFDGAIAVFDTKYFYNLWRPVTAIREGDRDKNRRTDPDPNWLPLIDTPPFPSYPSGHGGIGAAARRVLEEMFGEDGHTITLSNSLLPEVVLHYASWKQIADDVAYARIYGGIHYRFDQEGGASLGSQVGEYILRHKLRPVNGHY